MPLSIGLVNLKPLEGILIMHFGCFLIKMLVKFFLWSILIHFDFDFTLYRTDTLISKSTLMLTFNF